jgi:hypothetical protein
VKEQKMDWRETKVELCCRQNDSLISESHAGKTKKKVEEKFRLIEKQKSKKN